MLMLFRVYSNRFLRNHRAMVFLHVFPSCWKFLAFEKISALRKYTRNHHSRVITEETVIVNA